MTSALRSHLRPTVFGLIFSLLSILFGQGLGVLFGAVESDLKANLKARAEQAPAQVYADNPEKKAKALSKAWAYVKRAHMHAGGMGTTALALILLLAAVGGSATVSRALSAMLGVGSFGYSVYWLWAGFRTPGMGGSGPAKESLSWLAMPSVALFCLATLGTLIWVSMQLLRAEKPAST